MRWMIPSSLGLALFVGASAAVPVMAQARNAVPAGIVHACALLTDADIARITGRKAPSQWPADTSTLPSGHTECHWANLMAALTPNVTPQKFAATRKGQE